MLDLKEVTFSHVYQPAMKLVKICFAIDEANYPEGLKKVFVLNEPTFFSIIWKILKPFLDKR